MNYNQNRTILGGKTNTVVNGTINPGLSSLSSIVSYGLSTVYLAYGVTNPGVSSLSSIVSYGLSTFTSGTVNTGVSSLSSIVSYGLSSVTFIGSNTFDRPFLPSSIGGTDINRNNHIDSIPDAFSKVDTVFEKLISKPPKPVLYTLPDQTNYIGQLEFNINFSNAPAFYFCGQTIPTILCAEISLSYSNSPGDIGNPYSNINLFNIRTPIGVDNPGVASYINSGITSTNFDLTVYSIGAPSNILLTRTTSNQYIYEYQLYNYSNILLSNNNPYIFTFKWINNATYPAGSNNIFKALLNFNNSPNANFSVIS